jgi:hypothetical protein
MTNKEKELFKEAQEAAKIGIKGEHFKEYEVKKLDAKMAKQIASKKLMDIYDKYEIENEKIIAKICLVIETEITKQVTNGKFSATVNLYDYFPKKKIFFIFDGLDDNKDMLMNIIREKYERRNFKTYGYRWVDDGLYLEVSWK